MSSKKVTAHELNAALSTGAHVIDVRTPAEHRSAHVRDAKCYPLDQLIGTDFVAKHGHDKTVYVLCQSGTRAATAAERLVAAGHSDVCVVDGGTAAAIEAGLPIVYGEQRISLERQVRIAAGALVLTGTLAGILLHPGLLAIPAFVGAGLIFAGVTNTCGMGMMLSKMPWNR